MSDRGESETTRSKMANAGEAARILDEYERREREVPSGFYSLMNPAILFAHQERFRHVVKLLARERLDMSTLRILDVGCGAGDWLAEFESLGVPRSNLAGIDLFPSRVRISQARFAAFCKSGGEIVEAGADIRAGDASVLPWPAESFDIVCQSTVFSSILDMNMRQSIAREMARVLRYDGRILWYDLRVDNPRNRKVRGVSRKEIAHLFPDFDIKIARITLAPPLARIVVPKSWSGAHFLRMIKLLNTHYVGLFSRRGI